MFLERAIDLGRKEDNIAKAQAIMKDPKFVRNIGTAAHIDHGKCMTGEAMVFTSGAWIEAKALYSKYAAGQPVFSDRDQTVYAAGGEEYTISLNTSGMILEKRRITHVWKIRTCHIAVRCKNNFVCQALRDGFR